MWNPDAAATATSTASNMNIITADGIEPAADFRWALGERKRGSALPLVVEAVSRTLAHRAGAIGGGWALGDVPVVNDGVTAVGPFQAATVAIWRR